MTFFLETFGAMYAAAFTSLQVAWFIVLPIILYKFFESFWMRYAQDLFWDSQYDVDYVVIELIPPRDVERSPQTIEPLYYGIAGTIGTMNVYEERVLGEFNTHVSLELVSTEGEVHFYIWMSKYMRNLVETHLYAQYPDIEIREVEDYSRKVPMLIPNKEWDLYGMDLELASDQQKPIRSYRYFEEDVTGKMIDPMSAMIEALGSLGPGEHLWFQLVIHPLHEKWYKKNAPDYIEKLSGRKKKKKTAGQRAGKDGMDVAAGIVKGFTGPVEFSPYDEPTEDQPLEFRLTPGEKEALRTIEENLGHNMFETKVRVIYVGRREVFSKVNYSNFSGATKQFHDHNLNGMKNNNGSKTKAEFILIGPRKKYRQHQLIRRYRNRLPTGVTCIFSASELASLYHMPDMSVVGPGLRFVDSRRGSAPANLPTE